MDLQGEVVREFDLKHNRKNSAAEGIHRFKNFLVFVIKQVLLVLSNGKGGGWRVVSIDQLL
jgi:hypothetical protein